MVLHIAVALLAILLLYYWMTMKPKNFPPGKVHSSQCSDCLRIGRSGVRIPMWSEFSALVQTGCGTNPAFCTVGTESLFLGYSGRGMALTTPSSLYGTKVKESVGLCLYSPLGLHGMLKGEHYFEARIIDGNLLPHCCVMFECRDCTASTWIITC